MRGPEVPELHCAPPPEPPAAGSLGGAGAVGGPASRPQRVLVAVGPEAGWEEPGELELLQAAGFRCAAAGPRVLRSDVAVSALLALAGELVLHWDAQEQERRDSGLREEPGADT